MPTLRYVLGIVFALGLYPAHAQQVIQIPLCGGTLPTSINPSAPTIAVNPSGQVCIAGNFSASVPTPTIVFPQPDSVVVTTVAGVISGAYANGAIVAEGSTADGAATATFTSGSIITWLRGIFENTLTPISVSGSFSATQTGNNIALVASQQIASPSTYGVAPVGSVLGVNSFVTNNVNVTPPTPLNVTVATTPVAVTIASSPINVTGNFATTTSPQSVNLDQINGQLIASPSTYGLAPVGSVQGVNSFVTNNVNVTPPTPLQVTLPASPVSVGLAGPTPLSVVVSNSPTVVPTGTLAVNVVQATGQNIDQISGQIIASPSTYGVAPVGSVQGVNSFVTNNVNVTPPTPLQVTLPASPISVGIAGPTPLNVTIATSPVAVTGSFTSTQTGNNIVQLSGQQLASPSTYGIAPVGSTQGVNAFVTNNVNVTPPTPLQITLPASPVSVGLATGINIAQLQGTNLASPSTYGVAPVGSVQGVNAFVTNNVNVTTPTPLQITLPASPMSVGLAGPTPLNVTIATSPVAVSGSFTATQTGNNIVQWGGQLIASASTYGVAPVGSVGAVNAFVTNGNPNGQATMANSSPVVIASDQTPLNVQLATVSSNASPLNVTTPSPGKINIVQWQGTAVASPSTYGVAPVGSVGAVNAFVTNNVNVTPPTPLQVTLPASPISVGIVASPVSVGLATGMNLVQLQGTNLASPSTYGVAPVGSVQGVNAFVTSLPATPLNVTLAASPLNMTLVAIPGSPISVIPTPNIAMSVANPASAITAYVATTAFNVTNTVVALGPTPGIVGVHQLASAQCAETTPTATPPTAFLQLFDTTPHASGSDVSLGTTNPIQLIAIAGSPVSGGLMFNVVPGLQFNHGISIAFTQGGFKSATAVGVNLHCSFGYN